MRLRRPLPSPVRCPPSYPTVVPFGSAVLLDQRINILYSSKKRSRRGRRTEIDGSIVPSIQGDTEEEEPMSSLQDTSLHPPDLVPGDEGAEIHCVVLDGQAYVAERHNSTTAFCETWRGDQIQVTLCLARPPRVSYLCVFCPGLEPSSFPIEPTILATEEDLILLRIIVTPQSSGSDIEILQDADCYMYKATDEAAGGGPSLKRLPRLPIPYEFGADQVGIMRCGTSHQRTLCSHLDTAGEFYIVAALWREHSEYALCVHNSNYPAIWRTHKISMDRDSYFEHQNSKVITIGGDSGTMGFVDLWRGILFCDVLNMEPGKKYTPSFRYVTLPPPFLPGVLYSDDPRLARDIAVIQQGRTIKYVELQQHYKHSPTFRGYVRDGWMSRVYTRPVDADCAEDRWDPGCKQESSDIPTDNNPHFELLPKMVDPSGRALKPFKGLLVCRPTLSLHDDDDDLVYIMIKRKFMDGKTWVISVDMKNNTLQGVGKFSAERPFAMIFGSRISKYLTAAPGTKGNQKRPGMMLLQPCFKKPALFLMSMPTWDDEQKQHDTEMEVDGDDMVLT